MEYFIYSSGEFGILNAELVPIVGGAHWSVAAWRLRKALDALAAAMEKETKK